MINSFRTSEDLLNLQDRTMAVKRTNMSLEVYPWMLSGTERRILRFPLGQANHTSYIVLCTDLNHPFLNHLIANTELHGYQVSGKIIRGLE